MTPAFGYYALYANTTGYFNTAVGPLALYSNATGYENVAMGHYALFGNGAGDDSVAIGVGALYDDQGNNNVAVGAYAGNSLMAGSNNIDIGNDGSSNPAESNTIRIGQSGTQTTTYIYGIYGDTNSGGQAVYVGSGGRLWVQPSSARYKRDVNDMGNASSKLMKLRPVTFRYRSDQQGVRQYGLIAEEVERVYPEMVAYGAKGEAEGVRYEQLPAMLLNEMQKQVKQNQQQARQVGQLAAQIVVLQQQIAVLRKKDAQIDALTERVNAVERQVRLARPEHLASAIP